MSLDPNIILSSMLGSLIAMAGSIIVALLYIRNRNFTEKKTRFNEQIQETYIDKGILSMQEALSNYGINTTLAINDIRFYCMSSPEHSTSEKLLKSKINQIKQRPSIDDLIQRKFNLAMGSFSYLRGFGSPIYGSIVRTLQLYGDILSTILDYTILKRNIKDGLAEFNFGAINTARLIESTQTYLQIKLENLKDYIWRKDFKDYTDFLNTLHEKKYQSFISEFKGYTKLLSNWVNSMRTTDKEARKNTSLAFSKWINENINTNPLE